MKNILALLFAGVFLTGSQAFAGTENMRFTYQPMEDTGLKNEGKRAR